MGFYWNGYAEVLHLVTTTRCLPPQTPQRDHAAASAAPDGRLRRLWCATLRLARRRTLEQVPVYQAKRRIAQ